MVHFKGPLYLDNQTHVSLLGVSGHYQYKIVRFKHPVRNCVEAPPEKRDSKHYSVKLDESLIRSKRVIYELAFCNDWDYFFTGTLNSEKSDRFDLNSFHKDLTVWIRNINSYYGCDIKYLLIPEKHKDGGWHMHGLVRGIPSEHLHAFQLNEHLPYKILDQLQKGLDIYSWQKFSDKFGYSTLSPVRNHLAVCRYITKYLTKDLRNSVSDVNAHTYYHSRGLNKAKIIGKGVMPYDITPDFENDYVSIKYLNVSDSDISDDCLTVIQKYCAVNTAKP